MILVCGEALIDLFVTAPAEATGAALPAQAIAGGSPFNVAVGLARLGQSASYLGGIGADGLGDFLLGRLRAETVDIAWVKRSGLPTPLVVVVPGADGQPTYTFPGALCADRDVLVEDLPGALPDTVEAIAFGSWPMIAEPVGAALLALAEREAARRVISLDPNLRPAMAGPLPAWRERFQRFARLATLIKLSREDLHAAWGEQADPDALAAEWLSGGAELVVLTDGGDGAIAYHAAGAVKAPARTVPVIDTVGAGDTFHAALLAHLRETGHLRRGAVAAMTRDEVAALLRHAILAASITCSRRGADLPTRADLQAAL